MSQINVNRIKDSNEGAPDFPSGVNVSGITSTVTLGVTNLTTTNVNVSGVVTATTLDGNLLATGTPTLGLGVTINTSGLNISGVATAGIVSATTLYGDGSNMTGIALSIAPLNYNPAVFSQSSHLTKASGIGLTFNQGVKAGSGNVTLSLANAGVAGTVVENFGVGNSVSYSTGPYGTIVTITPTADLSAGQNYHLSYPSGAFTNIGGDLSYVGTAYTFQARNYSYQLWGWGYNQYGDLGDNSTANKSSPIQIPGTTWADNDSYYGTSSAIFGKTDGTLWSWGLNNNGQLGQNQAYAQINAASSPTQIGSDTTWSKETPTDGSKSGAAIKTDGTLWAWGNNEGGQLGQNQGGDNVHYSSPVQVGSDTTWSKVVLNVESVYATKTNATLWTWGNNEDGQLGLNNKTSYSSPIQIPGTTWRSIHSVLKGAIATKTDGTLWTWGHNAYGAQGSNTPDNTHYSSPTQIPGTDWSDVASGSYYWRAAIKTDGTLWSWGYNNQGNLGHNNGTEYSSPVQVPGTTWSKVACSEKNAAAIKTDGTLWSWGRGDNGALGLNVGTGKISSPTQIPGTTWSDLVVGAHSFHALKQV